MVQHGNNLCCILIRNELLNLKQYLLIFILNSKLFAGFKNPQYFSKTLLGRTKCSSSSLVLVHHLGLSHNLALLWILKLKIGLYQIILEQCYWSLKVQHFQQECHESRSTTADNLVTSSVSFNCCFISTVSGKKIQGSKRDCETQILEQKQRPLCSVSLTVWCRHVTYNSMGAKLLPQKVKKSKINRRSSLTFSDFTTAIRSMMSLNSSLYLAARENM